MRRPLAAIILPCVFAGCAADATRPDTSDAHISDVQRNIEVVDGRRMAFVPAAAFPMGCDVAEYEAREDLGCDDLGSASPVHTVSVPAFSIDVNEVTQAEFRAYVVATGAAEPQGCEGWDPVTRGEYPFACADWSQADAFCRWTGHRLCSEAEWELAARGPEGLRHPWGNGAPTCTLANLYDCTGQPGHTEPVASHPAGASPYGVEDMLGNAAEWVEDDYFPSHVGAPVDGSARVAAPRANVSVVKGGNFTSDRWIDANTRASLEHLPAGGTTSFGPGIRCCRSAAP